MALPPQLSVPWDRILGSDIQRRSPARPGATSPSLTLRWVSRYSELVQDSHHRAVEWFELEEKLFVNLHLIYDIFFCLPSALATAHTERLKVTQRKYD